MNPAWTAVLLGLVAGCALPDDYARKAASSDGGTSMTSVTDLAGGAGRTSSHTGQGPKGGSANGGATGNATNSVGGSVETSAASSGAAGTGNASKGGAPAAGSAYGGASAIGGSLPLGGTHVGGNNQGGNSAGNQARGGISGGMQTSGTATGGSATGGSAAGAAAMAGTATAGSVSSGGVGTGGAALAGSTAMAGCPASDHAAAMRPMPAGYCIDVSEVTRAQYQTWLATGPNPATIGQDPTTCGWNDDFGPDDNCMTTNPVCASNCQSHPVICVDWCDAFAYCKAVGKRLCGKIGGGPNLMGDFVDAAKGQWYAACSSGGQNAYPYGTSYESSYCQSPLDSSATTTSAVMSHDSCQSHDLGYQGVYDLSGNVWEWEDSCESNSEDAICRLHSGSFAYYGGGTSQNAEYASCTHDGRNYRKYVQFTVGFRCCT